MLGSLTLIVKYPLLDESVRLDRESMAFCEEKRLSRQRKERTLSKEGLNKGTPLFSVG